MKKQPPRTSKQFDKIIANCRKLFQEKMQDYGPSWSLMRVPSVTDQISIKAKRIRSIQEKGKQKVNEGIEGEFIGIINYSIIALIQCERSRNNILRAGRVHLSVKEALGLFDTFAKSAKALMFNKNHDYDEAWRDMRISSITDIILMKLWRVKKIEDNQGKTKKSEGVEANYADMINYAIFSLILMSEAKGKK